MKRINTNQIKALLRKGGIDLSALAIYWEADWGKIYIKFDEVEYAKKTP